MNVVIDSFRKISNKNIFIYYFDLLLPIFYFQQIYSIF